MTSKYSFQFGYNAYSLFDKVGDLIFEDSFRKKYVVFNELNIRFKTKWYDNFIYKKRVEIGEQNALEEIVFNFKKLSGVWTFCYSDEQFEFQLLRGYKSNLLKDNIVISEIDIQDSINLSTKSWIYDFTCENDKYLQLILICFLLFITTEDIDGLIAPNKNLIGSKG